MARRCWHGRPNRSTPPARPQPPERRSPSTPSILMLSVFGSRCVGWPLRRTRSAQAGRSASKRVSRSRRTRPPSDAACSATRRRRQAEPTTTGTLSVPARRPPPGRRRNSGSSVAAVAAVERPNALRSVHLVPGDRHEVNAEAYRAQRDLAGSLTRVRVGQCAAPSGDLRDLRDRLERARLAVGQLDRDERGALVDRGSQAPRGQRRRGDPRQRRSRGARGSGRAPDRSRAPMDAPSPVSRSCPARVGGRPGRRPEQPGCFPPIRTR